MSEGRPQLVDIDALARLRREVSEVAPALVRRLEKDLHLARNTDTWINRRRSSQPVDISREATRKISTYLRFR